LVLRSFGCLTRFYHRDKKVVGVFVRFRAPFTRNLAFFQTNERFHSKVMLVEDNKINMLL
jgi:hypothetical protein